MGEIVEAEERTGELHQVTTKKNPTPKQTTTKINAISCLLFIKSIISFVIRVLLHDLNFKTLGLTLHNTFLNTQPFHAPRTQMSIREPEHFSVGRDGPDYVQRFMSQSSNHLGVLLTFRLCQHLPS